MNTKKLIRIGFLCRFLCKNIRRFLVNFKVSSAHKNWTITENVTLTKFRLYYIEIPSQRIVRFWTWEFTDIFLTWTLCKCSIIVIQKKENQLKGEGTTSQCKSELPDKSKLKPIKLNRSEIYDIHHI